jgi:hypothetical protein
MSLIPDRLRQFFLKRFGPLPLVGIVGAGALFILGVVFQDWVSRTAVPRLVGGLQELLALPIGLFGLLLFALLVLAVVIAFVDTSPTVEAVRAWRQRKRQPAVSPVAPVSAEERDSVHRMRTLWNLKGEVAAERLHHLYATVITDLAEKLYWSELLQPMRDQLHEARFALVQLLSGDSDVARATAIETFNRFYRAYVKAAKWLGRLDRDQKWTGATLYSGVYRTWVDANREFREGLVAINEWPEYKGKLAIEIISTDVHEFLNRP